MKNNMRGMNFALDQINGEWFGLIGDDDVYNAFKTDINVVKGIELLIEEKYTQK